MIAGTDLLPDYDRWRSDPPCDDDDATTDEDTSRDEHLWPDGEGDY